MGFLKVEKVWTPHALLSVSQDLLVADTFGKFLDAGHTSFAVITQRARLQRDGESIDDSILANFLPCRMHGSYKVEVLHHRFGRLIDYLLRHVRLD